jgi:FkbM family methyltransferase
MPASLRTIFKSAGQRLVPNRLKERLFRFSITLMDDEQRDELRREYQIASMESSFRNLRRAGFRPRGVIDVGAYTGDWTRFVKSIFPDAVVLMVEAQPSKESPLAATAAAFPGTVSYEIALLGPENRSDVPFFELETGSSVLEEQSGIARRVTRQPMCRLDELASRKLSGAVDLLKLDVQGFELEVLRGAPTLLTQAEAVLCEVSLIPINRGAPLLADVVRFMEEHDFVTYDICSFIRRPLDNALWQTDVIFVRRSSPLVAEARLDRNLESASASV